MPAFQFFCGSVGAGRRKMEYSPLPPSLNHASVQFVSHFTASGAPPGAKGLSNRNKSLVRFRRPTIAFRGLLTKTNIRIGFALLLLAGASVPYAHWVAPVAHTSV